jgi:hypothetical protein
MKYICIIIYFVFIIKHGIGSNQLIISNQIQTNKKDVTLGVSSDFFLNNKYNLNNFLRRDLTFYLGQDNEQYFSSKLVPGVFGGIYSNKINNEFGLSFLKINGINNSFIKLFTTYYDFNYNLKDIFKEKVKLTSGFSINCNLIDSEIYKKGNPDIYYEFHNKSIQLRPSIGVLSIGSKYYIKIDLLHQLISINDGYNYYGGVTSNNQPFEYFKKNKFLLTPFNKVDHLFVLKVKIGINIKKYE